MKVLVACEESQEVCKAFRAKGHEAYSCDILPCSGGHPEWHIQDDATKILRYTNWDLLIAHPPCTYISKAGARWMYPQAGILCNERLFKAVKARDFFMTFYDSEIKMKCIENPEPLKVIDLPNHRQVIQPYQFGHPYSKKTLLWLTGLPFLTPTNILSEYVPYLPSNTGGAKRGQKFMYKNISQSDSSKTFPGIAKAMADQWG